MAKYKSCKWIEHGMVLDYCNVIRVCNNFNSVGGGRPILYENFQGEKINWDEFFKKQNALREQFRQGKCVKECEGCIGFEEKEWDKENYIDNILLTPWYECNSNCIYCTSSTDEDVRKNTKNYSVLNLAKDMIDNNVLKIGAVIDFAGGEPTLYNEFESLMSLFLNNGFNKIIVHTNSIIYSPAIESGIAENKVNVVVSIDAGSKDVHKKVKQVDSFDVVWKNFEKYAKAQKEPSNNVKSKYIIVPGINDLEEEIDLWLEKSAAIGIKNVIFNLDFNWLLANRDSDLTRLYNLMNYTIEKSKSFGLFCELYGEMFQVKTMIEGHVGYNEAGFFKE